MVTLERILFYIKHPKNILLKLDNLRIIRMPDKTYLKIKYKSKIGKKLDIENPKTFNEKLQWLKLYDRKDIYTTMVDKYEAKKYVANIIGEEYIIPTLGIYEKWEEIDFDKLPNKFVIKCTHNSGGIVICKDKKDFDIKKAKNKICKSLKRNFFYCGREWPYKNVKPRILIEKYMDDNKNKDTLTDYKFFCFDGIPKLCYVSDNSHNENQRLAFFDMNYKYLDIKRYDYLDYDILPTKPKHFEEMKKVAEQLSKDIPHVRVDLYEINGRVYFSELTFYTNSGCIPFKNEKWDKELGDMIKLPKKISEIKYRSNYEN